MNELKRALVKRAKEHMQVLPTDVLVWMVEGATGNAAYAVMCELRNRGMDDTGKWVGPDAARVFWFDRIDALNAAI